MPLPAAKSTCRKLDRFRQPAKLRSLSTIRDLSPGRSCKASRTLFSDVFVANSKMSVDMTSATWTSLRIWCTRPFAIFLPRHYRDKKKSSIHKKMSHASCSWPSPVTWPWRHWDSGIGIVRELKYHKYCADGRAQNGSGDGYRSDHGMKSIMGDLIGECRRGNKTKSIIGHGANVK